MVERPARAQSLTALILVRGVPAGSIVVPLPSSVRANRFRGDRPVEALVADAAGQVGLSTVRGLRMRRRVRDAVGLRSAERQAISPTRWREMRGSRGSGWCSPTTS